MPGTGPEVIVGSPDELADFFRRRFEAAAREAAAAHGRFAIALPGGSVAETFFPVLRHADVDWRRVEVFWGDERAVPPRDPEANYGLAAALWLDHVGVERAHVHRMHGEDADLDAAAEEYAQELVRALGGRPFDLVLLGMGPEGHVCSLFPGHAALGEKSRRVVAVHDSPKPPPRRLTLTLVALANAALVCLVAFDAEKAAAVRELLESPVSSLPAVLALRAGRRALVLLDPDAARMVTP